MAVKLALDRDFTRFINDETFPYKVTVCIGDEQIVCSGVLLAQQSSVLEKKFREDNGVLMFQEMLEVAADSVAVLHECIKFLHGAYLVFTHDNIEGVLKFASWYAIKDLFAKAIEWLREDLNSTQSVKAALNYLRASDCLDCLSSDSSRLKSTIFEFLANSTYKCFIGREIEKHLSIGVNGCDMLKIIELDFPNVATVIKKWTSLSFENKSFILRNHTLFNFKRMFPKEEEFSSLISSISEDVSSVEYVKPLLDIQRNYYFVVENSQTEEITKPVMLVDGKLGCNEGTSEAEFTTVNDDECSRVRDVYLYNLPLTVTVQKLADMLQCFGKMRGFDICYDLIQADDQLMVFVKFEYASAARKLLNSKQELVMDGNLLEIEEASDSEDSGDEEDDKPKEKVEIEMEGSVLYVGNIPVSACEDDLRKLFCGLGSIESVTIIKEQRHGKQRSNCYGFITFMTRAHAKAVLRTSMTQKFKLKGHVLKINKKT